MISNKLQQMYQGKISLELFGSIEQQNFITSAVWNTEASLLLQLQVFPLQDLSV